ncbi:hypothetical protein ACIBF6_39605 [Streptosporangium amethystogenes]|uniref:hypothetical protein n=1 Tax=Streptosporangium amethystogenes TaxID=2002 RepID=UPI0037921D03
MGLGVLAGAVVAGGVAAGLVAVSLGFGAEVPEGAGVADGGFDVVADGLVSPGGLVGCVLFGGVWVGFGGVVGSVVRLVVFAGGSSVGRVLEGIGSADAVLLVRAGCRAAVLPSAGASS